MLRREQVALLFIVLAVFAYRWYFPPLPDAKIQNVYLVPPIDITMDVNNHPLSIVALGEPMNAVCIEFNGETRRISPNYRESRCWPKKLRPAKGHHAYD